MRLLMISGLIALSSCSSATFDSAAVQECQKDLLSELKAPASYRRVKVDEEDINPKHPEDLQHPTQHWVTITYDAVNDFNAPLRGNKFCKYWLSSGTVDINNKVDDSDLDLVSDDENTLISDDVNENY